MKQIIAALLILTTLNLCVGQNSYPASGTALLNSGGDQTLILKDGRAGTNWNYIEWQFSDGSRDWVLGRRPGGYFTLWRTGVNEVLTVDNNGNMGIGTTTPQDRLHIAGDLRIGARLYFSNANAYGGSYGVIGLHAGTPGKNIVFYNYDGPVNELMTLNGTTGSVAINNGGLTVGSNVGIGTTTPGARLHVLAASANPGDNSAKFEAPSIGNNASHVHWGATGDWYIRSANNAGKVIIQDSGGNVGIGTSNPNQKLTVNGTIYGKEVKVDLNVPGPDYVFEKDYNLPSLEEIKSYVDEHKHLPEVPSAKEMEENGINVGEMDMILLKKIEELTLYVIELKKENEEQYRLLQKLQNTN